MGSRRTSRSHPLHVDFLDLPGTRGRIGLTHAPGRRERGGPVEWARDLDADLARIREHFGADDLVCLLEDPELERMEIADLVSKAHSLGLDVLRLPIRDFSVPESREEFASLVERILAKARQGRTVVIHCRGGFGRTGMTAAACLVALGYSPAEAVRAVRRARPSSVESPEQMEFIERLSPE